MPSLLQPPREGDASVPTAWPLVVVFVSFLLAALACWVATECKRDLGETADPTGARD